MMRSCSAVGAVGLAVLGAGRLTALKIPNSMAERSSPLCFATYHPHFEKCNVFHYWRRVDEPGYRGSDQGLVT